MRNGEGGGGGVEVELARAIRERIAEIVKDYRLITDRQGEAPRTFDVVDGYLPPKRSKDGSEVPFIIVRPGKGQTTTEDTRVSVEIIICTYSEQYDGHNDALNALTRIRTGLLSRPTLEGRYRLEFPLKWQLFDDQPYPQWQLVLNTEWIIPTPLEIFDEEV